MCDICSQLVDFEDNNVITNRDKTIHNDLCGSCVADVQEFIKDEHDDRGKTETIEPQTTLDDALELVKAQGYVVYKPRKRDTKGRYKKL